MRSTILTPSTTVTFLSNMTGIIFMSVVLAAIATRGTTALLVSSSVLSHNDEDYNGNQIDVYRNSSRRIGLVDPKEDDHDHHEKQQHHEEGYGHYTDQWAVHIEGGHGVADRIAAKHGFTNAGRVRVSLKVLFNPFSLFVRKAEKKLQLMLLLQGCNNSTFHHQSTS